MSEADLQETKRIDVKPVTSPAERGSAAVGGTGMHSDGSGFGNLLSSVYDALLVTDLSGVIHDTNARCEDFLLYECHEMRGMNIGDLVSGIDARLLATVTDELAQRRFAMLDAQCLRKDGSRFPAEIAVSMLGEVDGKRLCFFVRDLTIRKQAETALREALSRLEKADRARSLFVSNVTHELRTPLTSVMYAVSIMLKGGAGDLSAGVRRYLERIERETRRLLVTVNDILDLETLDAGNARLSRVPVAIRRIVERAVESMELHGAHKGIEMLLPCTPFPGFVSCDAARLERVMLNIVANAIKYTPQGGRVEIALAKHPDRYATFALSVVDTGVGIPAHALPRVMERYYRAGEGADGAGLGLSIAREIVEMHGGFIDVKSPPAGRQQGTAVSIVLPATDPPSVLVVDDEATVRETAKEQLHGYGYLVSTASGGTEGMHKTRETKPDALVLDIMLPGMDGFELLRALRADDQTKDMAVVVLTGARLDQDQRDLLSGYAIPVLTKPWRKDDLVDAVEGAIAVRSRWASARHVGA